MEYLQEIPDENTYIRDWDANGLRRFQNLCLAEGHLAMVRARGARSYGSVLYADGDCNHLARRSEVLASYWQDRHMVKRSRD